MFWLFIGSLLAVRASKISGTAIMRARIESSSLVNLHGYPVSIIVSWWTPAYSRIVQQSTDGKFTSYGFIGVFEVFKCPFIWISVIDNSRKPLYMGIFHQKEAFTAWSGFWDCEHKRYFHFLGHEKLSSNLKKFFLNIHPKSLLHVNVHFINAVFLKIYYLI